MKAKSLLDQWVDLKEDFPRHIVLIQCGVFYETYQEDAEFLSEISKIKTYLRGPCNVAGFPIQSIDKNQLEFIQSMKSADLIPGPKSLIVIGPDGVCQYDYSNPAQLKKLSCIQVSNPIEVS